MQLFDRGDRYEQDQEDADGSDDQVEKGAFIETRAHAPDEPEDQPGDESGDELFEDDDEEDRCGNDNVGFQRVAKDDTIPEGVHGAKICAGDALSKN